MGAFGFTAYSSKQSEKVPSIVEVNADFSNWRSWNINGYGPNSNSGKYCCNPILHEMGITFKYPPYLEDGEYQDLGGGCSYIPHFLANKIWRSISIVLQWG
jgi:hypothetical protein